MGKEEAGKDAGVAGLHNTAARRAISISLRAHPFLLRYILMAAYWPK